MERANFLVLHGYLPWQRLVFKSLMDTSLARILVTHHRFIEAFEWVPAQDTHKSDQIPPLLLLFVKILLDYSIIHGKWGGEQAFPRMRVFDVGLANFSRRIQNAWGTTRHSIS